MLRYAWVREWNVAGSPHYHLALLLNHDAYFSVGDYSKLQSGDCSYDQMLAGRIYKAWGVALGVDWAIAMKGVLFALTRYRLYRSSISCSNSSIRRSSTA